MPFPFLGLDVSKLKMLAETQKKTTQKEDRCLLLNCQKKPKLQYERHYTTKAHSEGYNSTTVLSQTIQKRFHHVALYALKPMVLCFFCK